MNLLRKVVALPFQGEFARGSNIVCPQELRSLSVCSTSWHESFGVQNCTCPGPEPRTPDAKCVRAFFAIGRGFLFKHSSTSDYCWTSGVWKKNDFQAGQFTTRMRPHRARKASARSQHRTEIRGREVSAAEEGKLKEVSFFPVLSFCPREGLLPSDEQQTSFLTQEIPPDLWARAIDERLKMFDCVKKGWVLDSFPKTREQALALQAKGIYPKHFGKMYAVCQPKRGMHGQISSNLTNFFATTISLLHLLTVQLEAEDTVLIERADGKRVDPQTGGKVSFSSDKQAAHLKNVHRMITRCTSIFADVYHTTFDWPSSSDVAKRLTEPEAYSETEIAEKLVTFHRHAESLTTSFKSVHKLINADQPKTDVFAQGTWITHIWACWDPDSAVETRQSPTIRLSIAVLTFLSKKPRSAAPHTPRVIILGPTGSGKSVQAALLASKYNIVHGQVYQYFNVRLRCQCSKFVVLMDACRCESVFRMIISVSCGKLIKQAIAEETKVGLSCKPYVDQGVPGGCLCNSGKMDVASVRIIFTWK